MIILKLAWRNVWRNPRRTILTLLTLIVGSAMIIMLNALANGGHNQMIEDAVGLNTGHIQIHEKGYWEAQTIDYAFQPSSRFIQNFQHHPHVTGISKRMSSGGLLSFKDHTRGIMVQGIEPEKDPSDLHKKILAGGRFLKNIDTTQAVIGFTLAKNIGAEIGDKFALISQGFDGSIAAEWFEIKGFFNTGSPEFDRNMVLITLKQANETFSMMGFVHSLVIRVDDADHINALKQDIQKIIQQSPSQKTELEIMDWSEMMPELVQFIVMDDIGGYIFDFILFLVVAFGVLNTIQMSVFERTREFGVMLSIGTRPSQIISIVLAESFFIALAGIAIGGAVGCGAGYYFELNPIDYSAYADEISVWGITTTLYPANVTWVNLIVTSGLIFFLSMIFSIFPARRAAKLNPVTAIRKL